MTIDLMRQGRTCRRNPIISEVFRRAGVSEGWGDGMRDVFDLCVSNGLPEPIIENSGMDVRVTLFRPLAWEREFAEDVAPEGPNIDVGGSGGNVGGSGGNVGGSGGNVGGSGGNVDMVDACSTRSRNRILDVIRENPFASESEISLLSGVPLRSVQREISVMKASREIIRVGGVRNGHWIISDNPFSSGNDATDFRIRIMAAIESDPGVTVRELCEITGIPQRTVERIMSNLKREGAIERVGGTRGQWIVKNNLT